MRRPSSCPSLRGRLARGFTLVEVLIAIVILSIGVLGALGMQLNAIRSNKEARYQAEALTMARELAEKMRGNHRIAIQTTALANPYLVTLNSGSTLSSPTNNCFTSQCTAPLDIAKWDVYEWQLRVRQVLPGARVAVCMDSNPFDASGQPQWSCDNTGTVAVLKLAWNRTSTAGDTQFTSDTTNTLPMITLPLTAGSSQ